MKAMHQKRRLEDVPEEAEAGWKSGASFAEGGLHIPLDTSNSESQSQASEHRRESVAALSQMGQVKNRLAMWEPKTGPAQQQPLRRSWNKPWKKPKQDEQTPAEPTRGTLNRTLAAIQQSVPQPAAVDAESAGTPRRGVMEALTPRRGSGESTPRGKAALSSPFLKQVQELFSGGLRRSGGSNLGPSTAAAEPGEASCNNFSPLGGGLPTDKPTTGSAEPTTADMPAGANEEKAVNPGSRLFASQLATEAAGSTAQRKGRFSLSRRKSKSPSPASPQPRTPTKGPQSPGLPTEGILASSAAATAMTLGAQDVSHQRKKVLLRSPKRSTAGAAAAQRSGEMLQPQPPTPEAVASPAQPSPTLVSIQKLVARQAASVGALHDTGKAQAVADSLDYTAGSYEQSGEDAGGSSHTMASKDTEEGPQDDVPMPLQLPDSPQAGAHHRASRKLASEDALQVTSPIREKTDFEDILAQHACSADETFAAPKAANTESSPPDVPAAGSVKPDAREDDVESPGGELAGADESELPSETSETSALGGCDSAAAESGALASSADVLDSRLDLVEADQLDGAIVDEAKDTSGPEAPAAQAQQVAETCGSPDTQEFAVAADSSTPVPEKAAEETAGNAGKEDQHVSLSPEAVAPLGEGLNDDADPAAEQKAEFALPEERKISAGAQEQLRVTVPEARVRCSSPFYGPESPARELDSLDSPLLQATLEEPSPTHISLQAQSEAFADTPTSAAKNLPSLAAAEGAQTPQVAKLDSSVSSSPLAHASFPALTLEAVKSPDAVAGGANELSLAAADASEDSDSQQTPVAAASPAVLTVDVHISADTSAGALDPEPSPGAERLVSERSLDEAEFVLLQEVMSKPLDPADQERVQAIADELFQEMQHKQEAGAAVLGGDSPHFSLIKDSSSETASEVSSVTAKETLDDTVLTARPPVPVLQPSPELRRLTETPPKSPRPAAQSPGVRSPSLPVQRRSLSPVSRRSLATPPRPGSAKSAGSSAASGELDSPLEEAVDELISHICDIEQMEVPVSTAKKVAGPSKEQRAADVAPVRLDMDGQDPAPDAAHTDALAEALAVQQADDKPQEAPQREGSAAATEPPPETPASTAAVSGELASPAVIVEAAVVVEAAAEDTLEAAQEETPDTSADFAAVEGEAEDPAPVGANVLASPEPAALERSAPAQQTPVPWRSTSKSLSPSPRRRPSPLQTALAANDENAAPASPAISVHSLPRSPSPAARSPGTKPATPKSAGVLRTPLSPHGNAQPLVYEPAAATEALSPTQTGSATEVIASVDAPEEAQEVAAEVTTEGNWQASPAAGPEAEAALAAAKQLPDTPATHAAVPAEELSPPATEVQPPATEPVNAAPQRGPDMETPVRGLRTLQMEPRNYADDDLLTPASVVPFPGFGDHTAGGMSAEEATPSTAPRVADPAPFLSNNNVVFSPDTPAEALSEASASLASERPNLRIRTSESKGQDGQRTPLETKFNLEDFSPPATRRISTGFTPPLHPSSARSAASVLESSPQLQPSSGPSKPSPATLAQPSPPLQHQPCSQLTPVAAAAGPLADMSTPQCAEADGDAGNPDSPAFDDSFALEAQLVLGGLITPATALRPNAAPYIANPPVEEVDQAVSAFAPMSNGQRACEMVEEAAAEAGLLGTDTQRLVNVLKPVLEGMLEDLEQQQHILEEQDKSEQLLRGEFEAMAKEQEELQLMLQKAEADKKEVQEHHALTEQQFKILYRSKYLPLKEEHDRCSSEMARLRDSRAAALEANEKWRAQVATAQLQVRKADLDADNAAHKIEQLLDELQSCRAEAEHAADALAAAEAEALRASRKNIALEAQLQELQAEREALKATAEDAETKVSAAQVARDRATKEVYTKDEEAEELRRRLRTFKAENDKFAGVRAQLRAEQATLQEQLAEEKRESHKLRKLCDGLMTDLEQARQK